VNDVVLNNLVIWKYA